MSHNVLITGGIGCGKSTVAQLFQGLGAEVLSADAVGHQLTQTGQPLVDQIISAFGSDYRAYDGGLDRMKMRESVFNNETQRLKLEAIMHPPIFASLEAQTSAVTARLCFVEIPLVKPLRQHVHFIDSLLRVTAPKAECIRRVQLRSNWSLDTIEKVMDVQKEVAAGLGALSKVATEIANDDSLEVLRLRVEVCYQHLLQENPH